MGGYLPPIVYYGTHYLYSYRCNYYGTHEMWHVEVLHYVVAYEVTRNRDYVGYHTFLTLQHPQERQSLVVAVYAY